jgi:hypothetical protein
LNKAVDTGNTETVKLLLQQGMDPRYPGPTGKNELQRIRDVYDEIPRLLLETAFNLNEAEINLRNSVEINLIQTAHKRQCECTDKNREVKGNRLPVHMHPI